ncbi:MAG TPA: hypothetical protein VFY84_04770 [Jiangellales bacterium]|nr:hypothetical protein [Jiangellales bacterium]
MVWGADKSWYLELTMRGSPFADDRPAGASSIAHQRIRLDEHQRAVATRAAQFAGNLDLPPQVCRDLMLAAGLHDEGKRDPRFQAMLRGGDHRRAEVAEHPLAKSGMDPSDRAARCRAQAKAGYPLRMRHEALSATSPPTRPGLWMRPIWTWSSTSSRLTTATAGPCSHPLLTRNHTSSG